VDVDEAVDQLTVPACPPILLMRMFERFTQEARQVVVFAQEEARALNHSYIGTEHLLLGLLREEEARGGERGPLHSLGVRIEDAREKIARIVGRGEDASEGQIPFTPRAKKVLELSLREALSHGHNWIGPEHILLGLARENEGVAARVLLVDFDADAETIRNRVIELMPPPRATAAIPQLVGRLAPVPLEAGWLEGLRDMPHRLAGEIRQELNRDPDLGDLLLAMACAKETLAGKALEEIGVDLDALWGVLERIRQQQAEEGEAFARKIEEVRSQKRQALQDDRFQEAARLRDVERELLEKHRSEPAVDPDVLAEIRRRLGLPGRQK
jgi:ATP-dependent Clp protease ATP-binding subunit ClpA